MKLAFVVALLASAAALSLAAPTLNGDEAMLEALAATLSAETRATGAVDGPVSDEQAPVTDVETAATSSRLVRYIRITSPRNEWMSISWVACYDRLGKNVCAGKSATSSNAYSAPWGTPATPLTADENINTGTGNAFISGSQAVGNWWRVDLGAPGFDIKTIKYRPRNDSPNQGQGLQITMEDQDGIKIEGPRNTFTTSGTGTQTFKVVGTPLGYTGKYDDHLGPVVSLLQSLRSKLVNAMKTSQDDVDRKKSAMEAAKLKADEIQRQALSDAAQAVGIYNEARALDGQVAAKSTKEIEMLDNIVTMVHTLNGKNTDGFASCLDLLKAMPGSKSGVYTLTPYGQSSPMKVYCDMTTQGGGWTLIAQTVGRSTACDRGASSCPDGERNLYNLRDGGGDFKNAPRGKATWTVPNAAKIAQKSTEIAIARWNTWAAGTGDISESNAAASYLIPNPSTVNFANPSHMNPDQSSRGTCVPVTVKSIVGGSSCANGCKRYTFSNSLGTTWTDTYPTSIGASTGSSCVNNNAGGPALASDDTGTFNPNYNGSWGKSSTQSGSPYYWHEGLWDVDSKNNGGLGTVWLR